MNEESLMELFSNPSTIYHMSQVDKLIGAGITTLMGMGTTFVVLVLIWGCIAFMTKLIAMWENSKKVSPSEKVLPVIDMGTRKLPVEMQNAETEKPQIEGQLVAVIAVAIGIFEGTQSRDNLIIRRIRRVSGYDTVWSSKGRENVINSKSNVGNVYK